MDRQRRVTSFTLKDLVDGHIDYVQRDHKNKEPTLDAFLLHVSDGVSQSPTHKFNITINVRLLSGDMSILTVSISQPLGVIIIKYLKTIILKLPNSQSRQSEFKPFSSNPKVSQLFFLSVAQFETVH